MQSIIKELEEFEKNILWINEHYEELTARYSEEYVAVMGNKVLAHGKDLGKLSKRIEGRFPEDKNKIAIKFISKKKIELIL